MRTLFRLATLLSVAYFVFFTTSCGSDTPGLPGGVTLPPVITLNSGAELVSFNQELPLSQSSFIVSVSGEDGDADLRSLRIAQNGTLIPAGQLNFRTGQTPNNPILIVGDDADGFTYEIEIMPTNRVAGDASFEFLLTDTDGETASTSVTVTYVVTAPTTELLIRDGFVSSDAMVTGSNFSVEILATRTENDIATISVLENGTLLDPSQLVFAGGALASANPLSVAGDGGAATIDVRATNVTDGEVRTYTFRTTDVNGESSEQIVNITFTIPPRDLQFEMMGVFFNASGRMLGGLDLDTGEAVRFNSPDAEIEDEGVNLNDNNAEKWRAQVSGTNGAEVRIANLSAIGDGVTFDDVSLQASIATAFEQGNAVLGGDDDVPDTDGDDSRNEIVTTRITPGVVLAVRKADGSRTYLVRFDAVNYVANSNNDNYSVSIKY